MPNIQSAKKRQRQEIKRHAQNAAMKSRYISAVHLLVKSKKKGSLSSTVSLIDRAVKKGVIHRNKAARLKSRLAKMAPQKAVKQTAQA
ncbi:MAG: 30S ribosomal protein S20 [Candidatus Roizmanbacteria bacterium]|nr:30S ribosomal protein S20 [Candidatus Roizmanbacteria bacterium]